MTMAFSTIEELRTARNAALAESDFLMLRDAPVPTDLLDQVEAYRRILRDLPALAEANGLEAVELPSPPVIPKLGLSTAEEVVNVTAEPEEFA